MTTTSEYLTRSEVSSRTRLSISLLEKLAVTGGGPRYLKIGKKCLYSWEDVQNWMDARKVNSTSEAPISIYGETAQ